MDPVYTSRIDYDEITQAFSALREQAATCQDIAGFARLVEPVVQFFFKRYWPLLEEETYRKGELGGMYAHITTCVEFIMPPRLAFWAIWEGTGLIFVHRPLAAGPERLQ